jgi:hypothetical protein
VPAKTGETDKILRGRRHKKAGRQPAPGQKLGLSFRLIEPENLLSTAKNKTVALDIKPTTIPKTPFKTEPI